MTVNDSSQGEDPGTAAETVPTPLTTDSLLIYKILKFYNNARFGKSTKVKWYGIVVFNVPLDTL